MKRSHVMNMMNGYANTFSLFLESCNRSPFVALIHNKQVSLKCENCIRIGAQLFNLLSSKMKNLNITHETHCFIGNYNCKKGKVFQNWYQIFLLCRFLLNKFRKTFVSSLFAWGYSHSPNYCSFNNTRVWFNYVRVFPYSNLEKTLLVFVIKTYVPMTYKITYLNAFWGHMKLSNQERILMNFSN